MSQSTERALALLVDIAERTADRPSADFALKELAASSGLDRATAHRLLRALGKYGFVEHDEETRRYRLGPAALLLARAAIHGHRLLDRAVPVMRKLSEATRETVSLSERQELRSVTIYEVEGSEIVRYANKIGRSAPLHVAAGARAILAFSAPPIVERVLRHELDAYTDATLTDADALAETLAATREAGYAHSFGERHPGVHSLAAPLLDDTGWAVASLCILWPSRGEAEDRRRLETWPQMLLEAADSISTGTRAELVS